MSQLRQGSGIRAEPQPLDGRDQAPVRPEPAEGADSRRQGPAARIRVHALLESGQGHQGPVGPPNRVTLATLASPTRPAAPYGVLGHSCAKHTSLPASLSGLPIDPTGGGETDSELSASRPLVSLNSARPDKT